MKYKLVKPVLSSADIAKLNFLANYMGYIFHFDIKKQSALFETEEHNVGYIQVDDFKCLFIVWKNNENIEYVDKIINIVYNMKGLINLPNKLKHLIDVLCINKNEAICRKMTY